jgi:hypothetical protein
MLPVILILFILSIAIVLMIVESYKLSKKPARGTVKSHNSARS